MPFPYITCLIHRRRTGTRHFLKKVDNAPFKLCFIPTAVFRFRQSMDHMQRSWSYVRKLTGR